MANLHKMFVYGTLKRGEPNHHWFRKSENAVSNFVAEAHTAEKYPLIIATKYNIPFLLFNPGVGHNVKGELYEIDDVTLENLDELEGHPDYYIRDQNTVKTISEDGEEAEHEDVWIYFLKNYKNELMEKPMLENYSNKGTHGLEYMEMYLRTPEDDYVNEVLDRSATEEQ